MRYRRSQSKRQRQARPNPTSVSAQAMTSVKRSVSACFFISYSPVCLGPPPPWTGEILGSEVLSLSVLAPEPFDTRAGAFDGRLFPGLSRFPIPYEERRGHPTSGPHERVFQDLGTRNCCRDGGRELQIDGDMAARTMILMFEQSMGPLLWSNAGIRPNLEAVSNWMICQAADQRGPAASM